MYFNKQVLRNAGIDPDSIYDAQKKGTWTWDMFEKLIAKCQKDLDGDGVDDVYGMTLNESIMPGIDIGMDLTWNMAPKADVDAIIDSCRDKWKKAIDDANKQK